MKTGDTVNYTVDTLKQAQEGMQDSLLAREKFIRDSVLRRQQILDSLTFLKMELPVLLEAYLKAVREDIMVRIDKPEIIGDSVLSPLKYLTLPFNLTQPYTPWKVSLGLSGNQVQITRDQASGSIRSIRAPFMNCTFSRGNGNSILVIHELATIQNDRNGQFYKSPFDSVFFDPRGRIVTIKRCIQFYQLLEGNRRGAPLFLNIFQVKQYDYGFDVQSVEYKLVNFCDRWKPYEANKVCNIVTYSLRKADNKYFLTRRNDPANNYSDGTFAFEFDPDDNLKSVAFQNLSLTENWQRIVELNDQGNVNCYIDKKGDRVLQSLCMIYNTGDSRARNAVETITTTYEEDGVSYIQKNNTTGLIRVRDKLTMEWGPWK
jgi:hypothetical protein